jgi:uncharacterized membrane protein YczE
MTMKANLGFAPWEVLHQGIAGTFGLTIGKVSIIAGFTICVICLLFGEKFGLGTVLDMLLVGIFLDFNLSLNFIPQMHSFLSGAALMMAGLFIISFGIFFYISSGFCAGPRDSLMVAIERKTGLAVGISRAILETSAVFIGWLLGGPVGIGTILSAFGISFFIQTVFSLLKFDPAKVQHETLYATLKALPSFLKNKTTDKNHTFIF